MPYDEALARRIREAMKGEPDISERKMFGGVAFMAGDGMFVGVTGDQLMARVGPEKHAEAIARPGAGPMTFTGRPMNGFLFVRPEAVATVEALKMWIGECLTYVRSLPPKKAKPARRLAPTGKRPAQP